MGRYLVEAHVREGRPVAELAAAHGVHRSWVYKLIARYRAGGDDGLIPRSRRPRSSPGRISATLEDEIVDLRKQLTETGLDAGALTIHWHLSRHHDHVPSVSSIWRILRRRGFVTPQPHKRPRSSYVRFEAELPNQCWQADVTHWSLATGRDVEILNIIDDHSRLCVAAAAVVTCKAADVVAVFHQATHTWGYPASMLTDNGAVFTAASRNGRCAMETELARHGITYKHSRPYHPQTCGKIERFHQTQKRWLAKQPHPTTIDELQTQLDRFAHHYNTARPHKARGRHTPLDAYNARIKATPTSPNIDIPTHYRVRHDRVDATGTITIRYNSRLHHIGIGRAHKHTRVLVLIANRDIRVLTEDGELLRTLTLDPTRDYQPRK